MIQSQKQQVYDTHELNGKINSEES